MQNFPPEAGFDDRADIIRRHLAEVFGSKNRSFLIGSGCSSYMHEGNELGIPTMGPLAAEFQTTLQGLPSPPCVGAFVTPEQRDALKDQLGIDLTHEDFRKNLERMMEVLMTAQQFCKTSAKGEFQGALETVQAVIAGVKKFILQKCTEGQFAKGDETIVTLYRRFYQSLATRSRGLAPPWVFTTNYDLFNERAMDRSGIPYSNGFAGTRKNGSRAWRFRIVGIFDGRDASTDTYFAMMQYAYFNAARTHRVDTVSNFSVLPAAGVSAAALAPRIDALFMNSDAPTRTQPEKQFLQSFLRQIADLNAVVGLVVAAATVTILMITVNTMVFAVRERRFEIGVLKTIGFSRLRIVALILSESLLVFILGGALGLAAGWTVCALADPMIGLVFTGFVAGSVVLLMLVLGFLSGLPPALNALRLPVIQTFQTR